ncbi:hypothetical protein H0H81_003502 [Sphagnurus paluster]|uniref:PXA domain-containing protein n=1 Tax=Sphagnurus paluster TaxID=117069 RepID=A0A9P7K6X5_9AGAR|nr:hypothetical protein H0H81_003502 [Sphagnurus paluster]
MSIASGRTRTLANRLLFPALPPDESLPPLVGSPELSAELYDFIALGLRAYVVPWWSRLSRYDKEFLPELTTVLAEVIREFDGRLQAVDMPALLLRHAPTLITQHYRDFRSAQRKLATSYASGGAASLPQLFHQLQPHMAVSYDGRLDTEYFRQLVDHVLRVCLPPADYNPPAERLIVREILVKLLLNDIVPKITQPWFIYSSILSLLQLHDQARLPDPPRSPSPPAATAFSFHTLLVLVLSAIQAVSGACLVLINTYKHALGTIKRVNTSHPAPASPQHYADAPLSLLADILSLPHRAAAATLLSTARLAAHFSAPFLDRLLPHLLAAQLSPASVLALTRTAKRTLFPNGYPGPTPIEPTPDEQALLRARLVAWRPAGALPARLLPLLLGPDPSHTLDAALDPLSSAPCNVHLVLFLLDLFLLELFPELALPPSAGTGPDAEPSTPSHGSSFVGRDGDSLAAS